MPDNITVAVFFFLPSMGGGSTTFTAHLVRSLEYVGERVMVYKVRARGEEKCRPFGQYNGVFYRNITLLEAQRIVKSTPSIMSAAAAPKDLCEPNVIRKLLKLGMRAVVHDPNEFKIYYDGVDSDLGSRPICIRPTMLRLRADAIYIPHPYMRSGTKTDGTGRKLAVSVARIASVKRPKIILEVNRLLPVSKRVVLAGAEHRLYTYGLQKKYGDVFQQSGKTFKFPMTFIDPVSVCQQYRYNVDMTWFPNDGGGTQYAQMEAMDAGCANIMHMDWFRYGGELRANKDVLAIGSEGDLLHVLRTDDTDVRAQVVLNGYRVLRRHAPKTIGEMYMRELLK